MAQWEITADEKRAAVQILIGILADDEVDAKCRLVAFDCLLKAEKANFENSNDNETQSRFDAIAQRLGLDGVSGDAVESRTKSDAGSTEG